MTSLGLFHPTKEKNLYAHPYSCVPLPAHQGRFYFPADHQTWSFAEDRQGTPGPQPLPDLSQPQTSGPGSPAVWFSTAETSKLRPHLLGTDFIPPVKALRDAHVSF